MHQDPIRGVMAALAQAVMQARPWWDVRSLASAPGPPGAGLLEVRAQLRHSGQYRYLRIWFRVTTSADEAVSLLDAIVSDPNVPSAHELYAWEWRTKETPP